MTWQQSRHWVFDMDGTLTVAVHDFEAIKRALEIPPEHDILHHLAALPAAEAAAKHAWLLEHERELAEAAQRAARCAASIAPGPPPVNTVIPSDARSNAILATV